MQLKVILIHAAPEFAYPTQEFWDTHSAVKSSQVTRAMPKIGLVWFVFWFGLGVNGHGSTFRVPQWTLDMLPPLVAVQTPNGYYSSTTCVSYSVRSELESVRSVWGVCRT